MAHTEETANIYGKSVLRTSLPGAENDLLFLETLLFLTEKLADPRGKVG